MSNRIHPHPHPHSRSHSRSSSQSSDLFLTSHQSSNNIFKSSSSANLILHQLKHSSSVSSSLSESSYKHSIHIDNFVSKFVNFDKIKSQLLDDKKYPLIQIYKNHDLEKEFLNYYYGKRGVYMRCIFIFAMVILIVFLITDIFNEFIGVETISVESYIFVILRCVTIVTTTFFAILVQIPYVYERKKLLDGICYIAIVLVLLLHGVMEVLSYIWYPHYPLITTVVLVATFSFARVRWYILLVSSIACFLIYSIFRTFVMMNQYLLPFHLKSVFFLFIVVVGGLVQTYFLEKIFREIFIKNKEMNIVKDQIEKETKRENEILLNIFPSELVETVKEKKNVIKQYADMTVVINDIAGFTKFSSSVSTKALIRILNRIYSGFDKICKHYELEKVKTIGDAYLLCSYKDRSDAPHRSVLASMDMLESLQILNKKKMINLSLRTGIGYGESYLAVIGDSDYFLTFDIFGHALNNAIFMEQTSESDKIQVCNEIKELVIFESEKIMFEKSDNGYYVHVNKEEREKTKKSHVSKVKNEVMNLRCRQNSIASDTLEFENKRKIPIKKDTDENVIKFSAIFLLFKSNNENKNFLKETYPIVINYFRISIFLVLINYVFIFLDVLFIEEYPDSGAVFGNRMKINFHYIFIVEIVIIVLYSLVCVFALLVSKNYFYFSIIFSYASLIFSVFFIFVHFTVIYDRYNSYVAYDNLAILCNGIMFIAPQTHLLVKSIICFFTGMIFIFLFMLLVDSYAIHISFMNFLLVHTSYIVCYYFFHYNLLLFYKKQRICDNEIDNLKNEIQKNEHILQSSLPQDIISNLLERKNNELNSRTVKNGNVLFLIIHNFKVMKRHDGYELINFLDEIFQYFDRIIINQNCVKIKSVQSKYLSINGLCEENKNKENLLSAAVKMMNYCLDYIKFHENSYMRKLNLTIGLHTGDFSCGVVGKSKFLFDVFGDSINVCCRLAQNSKKNEILCSKEFVNGIDTKSFPISSVGFTYLKGKGDVETFYMKHHFS